MAHSAGLDVEFDQSSGRVVSGLLSQENDFHEKKVSATKVMAHFCSFSIDRRCLHECKIECDHRELFSFLAQVTAEMWVIFLTSHDAQQVL